MGRTAKGNATAEAKAQIREANTAEAGLGNICWSLIARAIISAPAKENRRDRPVMDEDEDTWLTNDSPDMPGCIKVRARVGYNYRARRLSPVLGSLHSLLSSHERHGTKATRNSYS